MGIPNPNGVDLKDTGRRLAQAVAQELKPPERERNTEGWITALVIICATGLVILKGGIDVEWAALIGTLVLGYTGARTYKKTQEGGTT